MVDAIIVTLCVSGSIALMLYQGYKKIRYDWLSYRLSLEERKHHTEREALEIERLQKEIVFSPIQSPHGHMVVYDHNTGQYIEFEKSVAFGAKQNEQLVDTQAGDNYPPLLPAIQHSLSLVLLGGQGTGKTTLLCHILDQRASQGERCIVIDPHGHNGKYPYGELVGGGRDYKGIDQALHDAITEMNYRYSNYPGNFIPTTYFIDEFTLLHRECNNAKRFIESALTEFRKVNMRLVICLHSKRAKFMNLKGGMDLLEGVDFCILRNDQGNRYAELERSGKNETEYFSLPGAYIPTGRHHEPSKGCNQGGVNQGCNGQNGGVHGDNYTSTRSTQATPKGNIDHIPEEDFKILDLWKSGFSLSKISKKIFNSKGGFQVQKIKQTLKKYGRV